ncbi:hypothetical protein B0T10DRAFT_419960, partial [Thelonectria olida]
GCNEKRVKILLDAIADVNFIGGRFSSALFISTQERHDHIIELLSYRAEVRKSGGSSANPL